MDERLKAQAKERLEAILSRIEAESVKPPGMIVRHPQGMIEVEPGEVISTQEYAEELADRLARGAVVTLPAGSGWDISYAPRSGLIEALRGLAWLLGLSGQELHFVQHLAEDPGDGVGVCAFADWLEERGRQAEADRMRRVNPASGAG